MEDAEADPARRRGRRTRPAARPDRRLRRNSFAIAKRKGGKRVRLNRIRRNQTTSENRKRGVEHEYDDSFRTRRGYLKGDDSFCCCCCCCC
ncbi:hypothetical protein EUGRSUZ_F02329 [Eucalyptus grandis]|uniref:Uncharacterized protein n=2 Tax=Eucalyptus grandis TaxID=71139 RepID=A0ACC3KHA4_EUCGR|nr:hypothetical protein EUGRSUZ_F02329 [Eucalyptus grandis]